MLLFFFTVPLIFLFFISSTSAPKNKSKRRARFSECAVLMRGCSGSMRLGRKIKSQYTHYKKIDYTTDIYLYITD